MTPKRKKTEEFILQSVKKAGSDNTFKIIDGLFKSMNDKEFDIFMKKLRDKKEILSFIISHNESTKIDEHKVINELKKMGVKLEQRLTVKSSDYGEFTTPIKFLLLDLPFKRAAQTLDKKISVPKGSVISAMTGQVANESQGSKVTMPETQLLAGFGLDKTISEMFVPRGGDLGAGNAMDAYLFKTGRASLKDVKQYGTGVVSTKTLKSYLSASHIKSTL